MKILLPGLLLLAGLVPALPNPATGRAGQDSTRPMTPQATPKPKITTFLWFNDDAEEAIRFYSAIFPDSKVLEKSTWGEGGPVPKGTLMSARFTLAGQEFMALNGGPIYQFNEAISLYIGCDTQKEIDEYWDKLSAGCKQQQCGWVQDKFGLWWQVVPNVLGEYLQDKDPARAKRVMEAMLKMKKMDIAGLKKAYDGR